MDATFTRIEAFRIGMLRRDQLTKADHDELDRRANAYPKLVMALKVIAGKRTTHLRSIQMQEVINETKQFARDALADIGEDW